MSLRISCDYPGCETSTHFEAPEGWSVSNADEVDDFCPEHVSKVMHIRLERRDFKDALVGPYATEEQAEYAMNNSLLIQGMCEEDALEVYLENVIEYTDDDDVYIVDLNDPDHTGVES